MAEAINQLPLFTIVGTTFILVAIGLFISSLYHVTVPTWEVKVRKDDLHR